MSFKETSILFPLPITAGRSVVINLGNVIDQLNKVFIKEVHPYISMHVLMYNEHGDVTAVIDTMDRTYSSWQHDLPRIIESYMYQIIYDKNTDIRMVSLDNLLKYITDLPTTCKHMFVFNTVINNFTNETVHNVSGIHEHLHTKGIYDDDNNLIHTISADTLKSYNERVDVSITMLTLFNAHLLRNTLPFSDGALCIFTNSIMPTYMACMIERLIKGEDTSMFPFFKKTAKMTDDIFTIKAGSSYVFKKRIFPSRCMALKYSNPYVSTTCMPDVTEERVLDLIKKYMLSPQSLISDMKPLETKLQSNIIDENDVYLLSALSRINCMFTKYLFVKYISKQALAYKFTLVNANVLNKVKCNRYLIIGNLNENQACFTKQMNNVYSTLTNWRGQYSDEIQLLMQGFEFKVSDTAPYSLKDNERCMMFTPVYFISFHEVLHSIIMSTYDDYTASNLNRQFKDKHSTREKYLSVNIFLPFLLCINTKEPLLLELVSAWILHYSNRSMIFAFIRTYKQVLNYLPQRILDSLNEYVPVDKYTLDLKKKYIFNTLVKVKHGFVPRKGVRYLDDTGVCVKCNKHVSLSCLLTDTCIDCTHDMTTKIYDNTPTQLPAKKLATCDECCALYSPCKYTVNVNMTITNNCTSHEKKKRKCQYDTKNKTKCAICRNCKLYHRKPCNACLDKHCSECRNKYSSKLCFDYGKRTDHSKFIPLEDLLCKPAIKTAPCINCINHTKGTPCICIKSRCYSCISNTPKHDVTCTRCLNTFSRHAPCSEPDTYICQECTHVPHKTILSTYVKCKDIYDHANKTISAIYNKKKIINLDEVREFYESNLKKYSLIYTCNICCIERPAYEFDNCGNTNCDKYTCKFCYVGQLNQNRYGYIIKTDRPKCFNCQQQLSIDFIKKYNHGYANLLKVNKHDIDKDWEYSWCCHCFNMKKSFPKECAANHERLQDTGGFICKECQSIDHTQSKMCPKCKVKTAKDGGCDHIHCTQCEASWCWGCGDDFTGKDIYKHFNNMRCSVAKLPKPKFEGTELFKFITEKQKKYSDERLARIHMRI